MPRLAQTWPQINKVSLITSLTLKTAHPLLTFKLAFCPPNGINVLILHPTFSCSGALSEESLPGDRRCNDCSIKLEEMQTHK